MICLVLVVMPVHWYPLHQLPFSLFSLSLSPQSNGWFFSMLVTVGILTKPLTHPDYVVEKREREREKLLFVPQQS